MILTRKIEMIGLFANNVLLIVGMYAFGWTVFETLIYFLIEPIVGIVAVLLFGIIIPHKTIAPSLKRRTPYQKQLLFSVTTILITIGILVLCSLPLLNLAALYHGEPDLSSTSTLLTTEVCAISILLVISYLFPILFFYAKKGHEAFLFLPLQSKLMTQNSQQCQLLVSILLLYVIMSNVSFDFQLAISLLLLLKTGVEWVIYRQMTT